MSRKVEVDVFEILDLVSCADDYGFNDDVLMSALMGMCAEVSDEEIDEYCSFFTSEKGRAEGYSEEDAEEVFGRISVWRDKYQDKGE